MGFDFDKHDGSSGNGSQDNDGDDGESEYGGNLPAPEGGFDYHPRLYWKPYTVVEATISEDFRVLSSQYGQTVIFGFKDAELVQGALYEREGQDPDNDRSAKFKLYDYSDLGIDIDDKEMSTFKDFKDHHVQTAFGEEYHWNLDEARHIYEDGPVPEEQPALGPQGIIRVFADTNEDGPGSEAKRWVRLLTDDGKGNLKDTDTKDNWVDEEAEIAPELVGKRVRFWMTKETVQDDDGNTVTDDSGNPIRYNHLYVEDAETGDGLPVRNSLAEDEEEASDDAEAESEGTEDEGNPSDVGDVLDEGDDEVDANGFTDGVETVIDWCAGQDDEEYRTVEGVAGALEKMENAGKVEQEAYEGKVEEIAEAVQQRA